jgi:hypothetical protein
VRAWNGFSSVNSIKLNSIVAVECVSSLAETFVVPKPVADELFHEALRRAGEQP